MSKQVITGMREYDFKDESTGRQVSGMSVYYQEPLSSNNGQAAAGYASGKLSIMKGSPLYQRMLGADYSKPFTVDVIFDIVPGNRRPVLADIRW